MLSQDMEIYMFVFSILICLIGILGLIGNFIVTIVYLFDKNLRSYTSYFFVNLSITDVLIVIIGLPVALLDIINEGEWILGKFVCKILNFFQY